MEPSEFNKRFIDINLGIYKDDTSRWLVKDEYMKQIDFFVKEYKTRANKTLLEYEKLYTSTNTYCNNYKISNDKSKFEYTYINEKEKQIILQKINTIVVNQKTLKNNLFDYINVVSEL